MGKDSKINWDRGLKRITLIVSIVGAVVGAGLLFYHSARTLKESERTLARVRGWQFDERAQLALADEWAEAKTFDEQNVLWRSWTGQSLPTEPWWKGLKPHDPNMWEPPGAIELGPGLEKLPLLKKQGWETAKGEPLPYTPMGIWHIQHNKDIEAYKTWVKQDQVKVGGATVLGAVLGFGLVWAVYAVTRWAVFGVTRWTVWPLLIWITRGFKEDKQEDVQEENQAGDRGTIGSRLNY